MPQYKQFPLPDVGEGLTEAEILTWHVKPGDTVTVNQIIVEIETAKAAVELPCPWSGVVTELLAQPGDTVDVGSPIVTIDLDPTGPSGGGGAGPEVAGRSTAKPTADAAAGDAASQGKIGEEMPGGRIATLVGYGPRSTTAKRRPRKGGPPAATGAAGQPAAPAVDAVPVADAVQAAPVAGAVPAAPDGDAVPAGSDGEAVPAGQSAALAQRAVQTAAERAPAPTPTPAMSELTEVADDAAHAAAGTPTAASPAVELSGNGVRGYVPLAKPPVRKLAKELGVDLRALAGSGPDGVITREDVHRAAAAPLDQPQPVAAVAAEPSVEAATYDPATRERRMPIRGVRKATAAAMVQSAFTAPHVTEFLAVDVTPMMELRSRLKNSPAFSGVKITPLAFAAKALCLAVR